VVSALILSVRVCDRHARVLLEIHHAPGGWIDSAGARNREREASHVAHARARRDPQARYRLLPRVSLPPVPRAAAPLDDGRIELRDRATRRVIPGLPPTGPTLDERRRQRELRRPLRDRIGNTPRAAALPRSARPELAPATHPAPGPYGASWAVLGPAVALPAAGRHGLPYGASWAVLGPAVALPAAGRHGLPCGPAG